jgi:hypothetical protein
MDGANKLVATIDLGKKTITVLGSCNLQDLYDLSVRAFGQAAVANGEVSVNSEREEMPLVPTSRKPVPKIDDVPDWLRDLMNGKKVKPKNPYDVWPIDVSVKPIFNIPYTKEAEGISGLLKQPTTEYKGKVTKQEVEDYFKSVMNGENKQSFTEFVHATEDGRLYLKSGYAEISASFDLLDAAMWNFEALYNNKLAEGWRDDIVDDVLRQAGDDTVFNADKLQKLNDNLEG